MKRFMHLKTKILKHNTTLMRGCVMLLLVSLLGACKSLFIDKQELAAYKLLKEIDYPYQAVENQYVTESLQNILTEEEISTLENFSDSIPFLENFLETECVGCSNTIGRLKPVYRITKGKFIHFGLQNEMGVENWVFKKSGAFMTRFDMFQGESQEHIREVLKDMQSIGYFLEGVYPIKIDKKNIYLEHVAFEYQSELNNQWYQPMFPTKINYEINLSEKSPTMRFKIDGGLFSYQRPNENGAYQIINFVEPLVYANAMDIDEPMSYSSFTNAYYATATFFLLNIEERSKVSIRIESKTAGKDFTFSVFKNEGFHTVKEYLQKESPLFDRYQNTMGKGRYLVRVLHEDSDYAEKPLYTVNIDKEIVDSAGTNQTK
ncbi:hypothetical protein ACOCEA_14840 [Maribacter sp. CXY002]|uniref:hypothetical protein n=1 Tax=Maribacter luteocoastalis TaxID=3407671 RepID=UPI003B67F1FB